ncbi:MAG: hypothetical protein ACRBK7_08945 [Acidimicrobiales bacterium]
MEVQQQFGDDVRIIGIPGLSNVDSMQNFVSRNGVESIDHLVDPDGELWERFGVQQQRTYVYVNDDGTTRTVGYGSLSSDVEDLIAR